MKFIIAIALAILALPSQSSAQTLPKASNTYVEKMSKRSRSGSSEFFFQDIRNETVRACDPRLKFYSNNRTLDLYMSLDDVEVEKDVHSEVGVIGSERRRKRSGNRSLAVMQLKNVSIEECH